MPTIKDVALAAGCSTATVSRALATPEKVTEATRLRVTAAVAQVGYSPNVAARNLRRSESKTIVVLLPDIANPFFSEIIASLEEVAHRAGYQVLLGDCENDANRARGYFDLLRTNQADGIILMTTQVPRTLIQDRQTSANFPLVMACEYFDGLALPTVCIDNRLAAAKAVEYLLSLGHQRIATITGPSHNPICHDRILGYQAELQRAGLSASPDWIAEGDFSFLAGYQQGRLLLDRAPANRPTAIFCHCDEMAIGLLKAARDLGVKVPTQLSVVGFDNIGFSEYCEPGLTTISQPRDEIGRSAMRLLLDILNKKQVPLQQTPTTQLIVRDSTARCID